MIEEKDWKWYGDTGHFICSFWCRFHMLTEIGDYMISTVGEYVPDSPVRDIIAESRGIPLKGKGDERLADYMRKIGYEEIGFQRKYETMVFKLGDTRCEVVDCGCARRLPENFENLDFDGYNTRAEATEGHYKLCRKFAEKEWYADSIY